MTIPIPSLAQVGYRKEITFADPSFWNLIPNVFKSQWSLDIKLVIFDRNSDKISGSFYIEATSGLKISKIKNILIGQVVFIDIVSNSEKIFHRWTTSIIDIVSVEEGDSSTAFYSYKIVCEFSIPMSETPFNGSFVDGWWEIC